MGDAFIAFLNRHFVLLILYYHVLDEAGNPVGEQHRFECSGFIMTIVDAWFFVTAGHILEDEIDSPCKQGHIRIDTAALVDYLGQSPVIADQPSFFDYESAKRAYHYDRENGADFAIILLRPFYQEGLLANGILPIAEVNWLYQDRVEFEIYALLAVNPKVLKEESRVQSMIIPITRLEKVPEEVKDVCPRSFAFVGRVGHPELVPVMKGMSGSPIFAFAQKDGRWLYWVIALQSAWHKDERIVFGCSVPGFASIVASYMLAAQDLCRRLFYVWSRNRFEFLTYDDACAASLEDNVTPYDVFRQFPEGTAFPMFAASQIVDALTWRTRGTPVEE